MEGGHSGVLGLHRIHGLAPGRPRRAEGAKRGDADVVSEVGEAAFPGTDEGRRIACGRGGNPQPPVFEAEVELEACGFGEVGQFEQGADELLYACIASLCPREAQREGALEVH